MAIVLLWLNVVHAFLRPRALPQLKSSQHVQRHMRAPPSSVVFNGFLLADGSIENLKQYVPLATCSLVLIDIALGRPVANGVASALYKVHNLLPVAEYP